MMSSPTKTTPTLGLAQKRALLASRLRQAAKEPKQGLLSFAQQRLWFLDQLEPNSPLYNIGSLANISGNLNLDAFQRAFDGVVARHETLRTRFICPDETPIQVIDPHQTFRPEIVDLSGRCVSERKKETEDLVRTELNRPFDLAKEHPLRATLIRLEPQKYRLILILHHIAGDEWSLRILFEELAALYAALVNNEPASLTELPIQYADYAKWQRDWMTEEVLQRQLDYWNAQLQSFPPITELPSDHPRGNLPTFNGKTATRTISLALTQQIEQLAQEREATPFMVFLAAFNVLIHRFTQQDDLIICSPVAGRNRVQTENLIGFFVNTLALRTRLSGDPTFNELLARVREVTLGAMAHQDLPFERIVEELQPERTLTHLPFTKLMFAFQSEMPQEILLPGAKIEFLDVEPEYAKFELTLGVRKTREGLRASFEYNTNLFEQATIDRLLVHFETLLQSIIASPESAISKLNLLSTEQRKQILSDWNQTARSFPRDKCIHELFEVQVAQTPEAIATRWGHQKMNYAELNSRANQLASFLKQFDLKPDVPVGLCVERSIDMVVGILGILKAGGAYVPLDPHYPSERLAFMLEDSGAPVLLTQQRLLERVPRNGAKVICLDGDWELIGRQPRDNVPNHASPNSLAYIIYTSGSTGQPKGVAVPHVAVNRLVINNDFVRLDPSDRIAQVSNISFDAATFELWGALLNGAQLVGITRDVALSPRDFANELREQGITAMFLTAALFNQLACEAPGAFETLRTVIAGGEALDPKWVKAVLQAKPPQHLVNGYGPTENTTFTCCHEIRELAENASNVPIGRPISNTTVYVLDKHLNPVPIGACGELYTGGHGLARGYWNRPELTEQRFVPNPFDNAGTGRLYRTGDLARFLPDGSVEFLGRLDDQVKIRGFRIELGEIETLLGDHPSIRECVVTVSGCESFDKRLVAYVVAETGQVVNASELRSYLLKRLPNYMIPSTFVSLEELPLTPNGKVDRKALPAPDQSRPKLDRQYVASRDGTESQLVGIWENVLGVHPIGIQDKFFDLGGHSMLAVRVIAQIEKIFGRKLRLATLFQAPTVERLAAVLREEIKESNVSSGTSLVEIQGAGSRPPLFLVHGAGGGMFWGYINLARCFGHDQPVYGFKSRGLDGREELCSVQELAAQYVTDLRKVQPQGPYYLGGYCFGGNVAYEMACQLTEQGQEVGLLAIMNSAPPNSRYGRIPWTAAWSLRFVRNLGYWARYFSRWSPTQRREFFRWKWQLLKKRFARARSAGSPILSRLEPGDLVDLSSYTEDQKRIWETHIRALLNFRPRSFKGQVHLFRSPGHPLWCSFDDDYGWGDLAQQGVKVITVAAAHEKILEEPWVKALGEQISQALETARQNSGAQPQDETTLSAQEEQRQLGYWKNQLKDVPELLDLPADHARPAQSDSLQEIFRFEFAALSQEAVMSLAALLNTGPEAVVLSAFASVLHRYTGSPQIVIGGLAPIRQGKAQTRNPVAWVCDFTGDPAFEELVRRVTATFGAAEANNQVPFSKVVSSLRPSGCLSYAPIFQVALCSETPGLDFQFPRLAGHGDLDLVLKLIRTPDGVSGYVQYTRALFEQARIGRLVNHIQSLLQSAATEPGRRVSRLDLLTDAEARQILIEWNATELEYPAEKTLADLICEQARNTPDLEALVCGTARLTYQQLQARAQALAGRLRSLGVTNESFVGICLERSVEMVVSILATLIAGGAYVPLDPKYPADRLAFSLQDADCRVLITQESLRSVLPQTNARVLFLDAPETPLADACLPIQPVSRPTDLAYLIYTSGSTGKPKGVALEHRNVVAFIYWAKATFSPDELGGVLASTSICFDLSVFELFVPLCSGGKVILADNALALPTLPCLEEVRLINTVPSAIRELLRLRAVPPMVSVINLAGEPLSAELVDQIYEETSVRKVFDLYGPTETTTYSTGGIRKPNLPATIGRPLSNEQVYLVDSNLQPVPVGVPGELLIGGAGVARGYLNRPDLTSQKFIQNPFRTEGRLYRTGDLARWCGDGTLEYLGRIDHQVKIRGFRIELGEIEAVLKTCEGVSAAVTIAREDHPGDKRLAAYVVPHPGASLQVEHLRQQLRVHLPDFMVPADIVFLPGLPMTPNGKIDRKALPAPTHQTEALRVDRVAPRNEVEARLVNLWSEVLHYKQISICDNFFDLGGHSLLAVRILSGIRDIWNIELPLTTLFSAPTVAALAEAISLTAKENGRTNQLPIRAAHQAEGLPVSYVQERLWFLDLLEPGSAAYNVPIALRLKGALNEEALRQSLDLMVSRHAVLRTTFLYSDGVLTQKISDRVSIDVECVDLQDKPVEERERRACELLKEHARLTFDLTAGPLVRFTLLRLSRTEHVLLVVMHHSISDGWSMALFFQELGKVYDAIAGGQTPSLPAAPTIQYGDFACWQREWMTGAVLEGELSYWTKALEGAPGETGLPFDFPRPVNPSGKAEVRTAFLDASNVRRLAEFTRSEGCTQFMFFLTSLLLVLRKWTGQQDLVVGTVVAGRTRREIEDVLGCFMNFLPLRARIEDRDSGRELLKRVRSVVLDGQSHQNCPFEKIVEAVNPQRKRDQNPLYNVALLLQNFPHDLFHSNMLQGSQMPVSLDAALLDLRFEIEELNDGLSLACEFKTDLFKAETIECLLASWLKSIENLVNQPQASVGPVEAASGAPVPSQHRSTELETIIIAATFTAEPIREPLEYWFKRLEMQGQVVFAPYNQVFQQLLDPSSALSGNRHGANVLIIRLQDWVVNASTNGQFDRASSSALEQNTKDLLQAIKANVALRSTPLLITFSPVCPLPGLSDSAIQQLNRMAARLEAELSGISGLYVLSSAELAAWYPVADFYDRAAEELGHVPYTPQFFTALATALARKLHALKRPAYKVIALDCDNTLWSGVCGEDGPRGIQLDGPRRALQQFMLVQRQNGMLLCLCSKNNEEDVRSTFNERVDFPLRLDQFAAARLNWEPKSTNLKSLAYELGLGLDSFIFIDDNPVECAEVQANCPEVLVLQLPEDPSRIPQILQQCWAFDHLKVTAEDRQRNELYQQNRLREQLRTEAPSLKAFLDGLGLKVDLGPIAKNDYARVAQLTQRTNQFNLTTRRRSESELAQWLNSAEAVAVRVSDRFGDYGLVGVALYHLQEQALAVDTLLLSCRVLGRGVEHRMVSYLGRVARERGAEFVDLHFVPTSKNKPALDFLERMAGAFKQPLNGGSVFRLPAEFAQRVALDPDSDAAGTTVHERLAARHDSGDNVVGPAQNKAQLRRIAMDCGNVSEIHAAIQGSTLVRSRPKGQYAGPQSQLERKLCLLWQELLHVEPVGIHDDFFELGGHSLLAVRLFVEIEKIVGRKFPLVTLFQAPTVSQLAKLLSEEKGSDSLIVPIQPRGSKTPLFLVHGAGGDVLWGYANLAANLSADQPVFGIKSHARSDSAEPLQLEDMARSYLEVVRSRQSVGPYFLGGYCFGGNVAYEMARQLRMQGEQVALVLLIDTAPANAGYENVPWYRPSFTWRFALNLRYWLADFSALQPVDRRKFIARKARWVGRKVKRRFGLNRGPTRFDLEEVIDPDQFPEQELKLWQEHLEALIVHVERPYGGRVVLLRTRGQPLLCSLEEDFCWSKLVKGGVEVRHIPGSHEHIFMEPHVRVLASEISGLLQKVADATPNTLVIPRATPEREANIHL